MDTNARLIGLHHVALVTPDPERAARFYSDVLGMQVSAGNDTLARYVLSFGHQTDAAAPLGLSLLPDSTGTAGELGVGTVHHVAFTVESDDALLKWKRRLQSQGVLVAGPYNQQAYRDIVFTDPDGVIIELATRGPGWAVTQNGEEVYHPAKDTMAPYRDQEAIDAETWPEPVTEIEPDMRLSGLHHVSTIVSSLEPTNAFYLALGLSLVRKTIDHEDSEVEHWYWGLDGGRPGTMVTAFPIVHPTEGGTQIYGRAGVGVAHHPALGAALLDVWERVLLDRGIPAAPRQDGIGLPSLALHDPDGLLIELAAADLYPVETADVTTGGG